MHVVIVDRLHNFMLNYTTGNHNTTMNHRPFSGTLLTLLLIDHLKQFKISTFKNAHWFCTHMVIPFEQCWWRPVLHVPFKSIQMVLEGPLIHHLHVEVSKQGFVLAVLPFGKIQTRFCIS